MYERRVVPSLEGWRGRDVSGLRKEIVCVFGFALSALANVGGVLRLLLGHSGGQWRGYSEEKVLSSKPFR